MYGEQPTAQSHPKRPLSAREVAREEQRQKSVIERKLQFSVDGHNLIVATHFGNPYGWTTNDGDLTCIFYDKTDNLVFLAAYLGKDYPVLFSLSDPDTTSDLFSTKILHAAQSPSGSQFAVANGMAEIYLCNYNSNRTLNPCRMKKVAAKIPSTAFTLSHMVLALPQENHMLAFWIKGEKLFLRSLRVRDGSNVVTGFDLWKELDALAAARPPDVLGFQLRPRRQSLVSIAEMEARPFIPSPGLAELPTSD